MSVEAGSVGASKVTPVKAWWSSLAPRERRLVSVGVGVLLLYLLFAIAVQPAWHTVRAAPAQLDTLDAELQGMQRLAGEVAELRATPPVNTVQSMAALKAASERLGDKGHLTVQGDRAVLTLSGASTEQLRGWLAEARSGARARPVEATLARGGAGGASGYSGSIVVIVGGGS